MSSLLSFSVIERTGTFIVASKRGVENEIVEVEEET